MNTQSYQQIDTTETEIDLVALLKRVCVQWRAILIFSIIIGLLASGIKYAKDTQYSRPFPRRNRSKRSPLTLQSLST